MHGIELLLSVFGIIFVAELPDKTALASLVLATRHRPLPVFLGAALALTIQSVVAVLAGGLLFMLPAKPVHIGAGLLFIGSAYLMWRRKHDSNDEAERSATEKKGFWRTLWTVFLVVFVAEWGDLTQLGTAALAARYGHPVIVFVGATAALWCVAGAAVFLGNRAAKYLNPRITQRAAAFCFAGIGVALTTGIL
jgi:putative Ca2+/H+ antiporter (TMEM165/GDT1 family)